MVRQLDRARHSNNEEAPLSWLCLLSSSMRAMTRTLFALAVGWEKLSRAHASPMNCYGGEFKGWTKDEARLFSQKLLAIIQRRDLIAISCGIRVDDFFEVFTENNRKTDMGVVYSLCMKQVMVELAHALDYLPDHKVSIVHDQGNWDADANQAYTAMRDDPRWPLRDRFVGIAPKFLAARYWASSRRFDCLRDLQASK